MRKYWDIENYSQPTSSEIKRRAQETRTAARTALAVLIVLLIESVGQGYPF